MRHRNLAVSTLSLALASTAFAQDYQLAVGDAAPGLDVEEWVKGDETTITEGNVFVVEFWATWCAPCRKSIPHLTELQKRYADQGLTIIGVSTEDTALVKKFVKRQGSKMDYTVAVDRRKATERAWMTAAGKKGIPTAFIVDKRGKLQFIGHPLSEEFEDVLEMVLDGRYDAKLFKKVEPMYTAAKNARKVRNWRMSFKMLDDIIKEDPHVFAFFALDKFEMKLVDMDDPADAYTYARQLLVEYADDPSFLAALAEMIVVSPKIENADRNLEVAMEAARQAGAEAHRNEPKAYAVQALVHYHAGRLDEAISLQKKAYFVARPKQKAGYKRVLDSYRAAAKREASTGS